MMESRGCVCVCPDACVGYGGYHLCANGLPGVGSAGSFLTGSWWGERRGAGTPGPGPCRGAVLTVGHC